jgi:hypothetical protein
MTMTPKQRALVALADSKDRPFLSNAPLMAIVEAVQVLDEAGLLGCGAGAMRELADDARRAKSALGGAGFPGLTLEAQVRALVVAWSGERDEARRLRAGLNIPVSEETRARIMAAIGSNPGSKHAIMYAARVAPWVSSVEWRDGGGGPVLVIETCDGTGLDDLRRSELRAALDTQRAAGVPIVAEIDGWPFTHPEVPLPCPEP